MIRTDDQIISRAGKGDLEAFTLLVETYRAPLISYLMGLVRTRDEAEELAQEAFCRAWQGLPRLRDPSRLVSWLYQTAHNLAVSALRRPKLVALPPESEDQRPEKDREHLREVHKAVGQLPEPYRTAVALRHFSGMSHEQISRQLSVPEGTVRSRLSRGYGLLRERLRFLMDDA